MNWLDKSHDKTHKAERVPRKEQQALTTSARIERLFTREWVLQKNLKVDKEMNKEYSRLSKGEKRRIEEIAKKLEVYEIKYDIADKVMFIPNLKWTKELEKKLELLKWKSYAPPEVYQLLYYSLSEMEDIESRVDRAEKLQQIGLNLNYRGLSEDLLMSGDFDDLLKFLQSKDGQLLLNYFKWESYGPKSLSDITRMIQFYRIMERSFISDIEKNIKLADKLEEYNVKVEFHDIVKMPTFTYCLSDIKWTKELEKKLELLKWKSYAPKLVQHVFVLQEYFSLWDIKNLIKTMEERKLEGKYIFWDLQELAFNK